MFGVFAWFPHLTLRPPEFVWYYGKGSSESTPLQWLPRCPHTAAPCCLSGPLSNPSSPILPCWSGARGRAPQAQWGGLVSLTQPLLRLCIYRGLPRVSLSWGFDLQTGAKSWNPVQVGPGHPHLPVASTELLGSSPRAQLEKFQSSVGVATCLKNPGARCFRFDTFI